MIIKQLYLKLGLLCELCCYQKSLIALYNSYHYYKDYLKLLKLLILLYVFVPSQLYIIQLSNQYLVSNKCQASIQLVSNYLIVYYCNYIAIYISIYLYTEFIQLVNWPTTSQITHICQTDQLNIYFPIGGVVVEIYL